jgi:hypothetical protein
MTNRQKTKRQLLEILMKTSFGEQFKAPWRNASKDNVVAERILRAYTREELVSEITRRGGEV